MLAVNRLLSKTLLPSLTKIHLPGDISKRFYPSFSVNDPIPIGNANGRLRSGEEAYCDQLSTPFKQPYLTVIETITNETQRDFDNAHMMVSKVQGKLLRQLVGLLRPNKVLEIGGFTGSSAIAMGSALSPNASLLSLELDPKHVSIAERHVKSANLQDKVKFKQGSAGDSLMYLVNQSPRTRYDFIFLGNNVLIPHYYCNKYPKYLV
ncbi:S-adenosyl-L-methionine-dependent methyltransferase [Helicostylum pulchrum]|nr:S-adenosyl-L-methionine-dependent methyltransferase [Helicostylum pulchrum]